MLATVKAVKKAPKIVEIGKTLEKYTVKRSPAIKGAVSKSKGVVENAAKARPRTLLTK